MTNAKQWIDAAGDNIVDETTDATEWTALPNEDPPRIRVTNSTTGLFKVFSVSPPIAVTDLDSIYAVGGTESQAGSYRVHEFVESGFFIVPFAIVADVLHVGGGGAGGSNTGGGGGGGEVVVSTDVEIPAGTYFVAVGLGGVGSYSGGAALDGRSTSFRSTTVLGGGGGGHNGQNGAAGASGGGGGTGGGIGGAASAGYAGGDALDSDSYSAGGGGGAGSVGATSIPSDDHGGNGGTGITNAFTGASLVYAAGGGGGTIYGTAGGTGGGGAGGDGGYPGLTPGTDGVRGSGGGGNGNADNDPGGSGGDGVLVIRYLSDGVAPSTIPTQTTFGHDDAAVGLYGRWETSGGFVTSTAHSSQVWFRFYGSTLEIQAKAAGTGIVKMTIDDGALISVDFTNRATWQPIYNGAIGWHDVCIFSDCEFYISEEFVTSEKISLVTDDTFRVTGSNGSEDFAPHTHSGVYEQVLTTPFTTYGIQTCVATSTDGGYSSPSTPALVGTGTPGYNISVRRKATWTSGSKVLVWCNLAKVGTPLHPNTIALRVDGIQYGTYSQTFGPIPVSSIFEEGFIIADLPGSGTHEIEIISSQAIDAIMITDGAGGSDAYFTTSAVTARAHKMVALGDSQTAGYGANAIQAYVYDALCSLAGCDLDTYNVGISGNTVAQATARFATDVTVHDPNLLAIHLGYNNYTGADFASLKADYKLLLDEAISELSDLDRIFCILITVWENGVNINLEIEDAVDEWITANPTWATKVFVITPEYDVDDPSGHIGALGYAQMMGEDIGICKLTAQPADGNTLSMTAGGVTKVFEFDSNSSITGGRVAVTIGATAEETNENLFLAIVAQYAGGWAGVPFERVQDDYYSLGCVVSNLSAISKIGANLTVFGPYATGIATQIKANLP